VRIFGTIWITNVVAWMYKNCFDKCSKRNVRSLNDIPYVKKRPTYNSMIEN
jgi:hypothetical protein